MGLASLILGILAIIASFIPVVNLLGGILGIIGIILGVQGKENPETAGSAKAGLVCSIIGTVLCLSIYIACVACIGGLATLA